MKKILTVLAFLYAISPLYAQLVEGNPCVATCIDPSGIITGRQPNQNNLSPNQNLPCGSGTSEDNPAWWVVRPSGNSLTFTVTTTNCVAGGCGLGVQMTLWEGDNCGSVTAIDCVVGTSGTFTSSVTPCKVYYLQVDGLCECQCNITLAYDKNQILKSVPKPEITGPKTACVGATLKLCASIPGLPGCRPDGYTWRIDPAGSATVTAISGEPDCANVKINSVPPSGKLKICAKPKFNGKCPPSVQEECFEIEVINLKPATCDVKICAEERPYEYELKKCIKTTNPTFIANITPEIYIINDKPGTQKTQKITYTLEGTSCKSDVSLNIEVQDNKVVQIPPIILCENETKIVKQQQFTCADAAPFTKLFQKTGTPKPSRCDTTFEILVECIKIEPKITGAATLDCSKKEVILNAGGFGTLTLPNDVNSALYKGKGKREYQWFRNGDLMPSETNATLKVDAPGVYMVELKYTYEIEMTINGVLGKWSKTCSKTEQVEIKGQAGSAVAEEPISSGTPCANGTAVYSINPDPLAQQYTWTVTGATKTNESTNPSGVVAVTVTNTGQPYTVCLVKKVCDIISAPHCITATPVKTTPKPNISGDKAVCNGDNKVYRIANLAVYSPYAIFNWQVSNGTIIGGSTSNQVLVNWNSTTVNGALKLTVSDLCGTKDTTFIVEYINFPAVKPSIVLGKKIVCVGENEKYEVQATLNASYYIWNINGGGTTTVSSDSKSMNVFWQTVGKYSICVSANNNCFTSNEQYCFEVEVKPNLTPFAGNDKNVCSKSTSLKGIYSSLGTTLAWSKASGPGSVTFENNNTDSTFINVSECGEYVFEFSESNTNCTARDSVKIRFSENPALNKLSYLCNILTKTYDLNIQLNGCFKPFSAINSKYPTLLDSITGNLIVKNIPSSDSSWGIVIQNTVGCHNTIPIKVNCDCVSYAGTMKLEPTIMACSKGGKIKAKHNSDQILDSNDTYTYVLHEGKGATILFETSRTKTGEFSFNPATMQCGKTYYISYIVGSQASGEPDITDKCLSITPEGQPVIWHCQPSPTVAADLTVCGLEANLDAANLKQDEKGLWKGTFSSISDPSANKTKVKVDKYGAFKFWWIVQNNTCKDSASMNVTFLEIPKITAGSNSPICEGETLLLLASGANSYTWTGPINFNSNSQNPIISFTKQAANGKYKVEGTSSNGCKNTTELEVVIKPKPLPTITTNSPVCTGKTALLLAIGGTSYFWSGPDNFSSTLANPTIPNVQAKNAGLYIVEVTNADNCKGTTTTNLVVENCISSNDITNKNVQIYPNPFTHQLNIDADEIMDKIMIYNTLGQIILEQHCQSSKVSLDVSTLPSAHYNLKINWANGKNSEYRVMKQ